MKPLLVSSGEPAGIGPDICLALADLSIPLVVMADQEMLSERAQQLNRPLRILPYLPGQAVQAKPGQLTVMHLPVGKHVEAGKLNPKNAEYVMRMLTVGVAATWSGEFAALVTAPVHKGIINEAGIPFTGHTEFLAEQCCCNRVVMMLACPAMRVALMTTHLPLHAVPAAISPDLIAEVIEIVHQGLRMDFGIDSPLLRVAGLNPHAGESGYLGREEIDTISPALDNLRAKGIRIEGPMSADTMFIDKDKAIDVFIAMYHDQGLPVIKYAGFADAVNITLGLPIIRTSVDHGTATHLAGTGLANPDSLLAAVRQANTMIANRKQWNDQNQSHRRG